MLPIAGYSATFTPPALVLSVPEPSGDPVTVKVLTEFGTQQKARPAGHLIDHAFSRSQVSAHLSEMDARLAALRSIADNMDREFANTRLVSKIRCSYLECNARMQSWAI